jgi:hypothetical protein
MAKSQRPVVMDKLSSSVISNGNKSQCVTIGDIPQCTCPYFIVLSFVTLGKKRIWMYCNHLYHVFIFLNNVDYDNDKFIHTPTYTYDEVMRLVELVYVVEHK